MSRPASAQPSAKRVKLEKVKPEPISVSDEEEEKQPVKAEPLIGNNEPLTDHRPNDPIMLSIFAEKGGVGKTTTAATVAWQLAKSGRKVVLYDCDAQRSLTAMLFTNQMEPWFKANPNCTYKDWVHRALSSNELADHPLEARNNLDCRTLCDQMNRCVKSQSRGVTVVPALALKLIDNLYVVPGDRLVGDFDSRITVGENLFRLSPDQAQANSIWTGMPYACVLATGRAYQADYVILDLNPSGGVLNRCLVGCSHFLLIPVIADFFSREMLNDMGDRLINWCAEINKNRAAILKVHPQCFIPPPSHRPKYLGYVLSRYDPHKKGAIDSNTGLVTDEFTKSESYWADRIDQASEALYKRLSLFRTRLAITPTVLKNQGHDNTCRAKVRNFKILGDLSDKFSIPVPFLKKEHLVDLQFGNDLNDDHKKKSSPKRLLARIAEFTAIFEELCYNLEALCNA